VRGGEGGTMDRSAIQILISTHGTEIAELCRRYHVRRLDVFGSAGREDFDPARSDLDFVVEFERDHPLGGLEAYFGLKEALEALFGRKVDLVSEGAVRNPYLRKSIDESRETVYAA
jgi:predicted nucleotidyltransferase